MVSVLMRWPKMRWGSSWWSTTTVRTAYRTSRENTEPLRTSVLGRRGEWVRSGDAIGYAGICMARTLF